MLYAARKARESALSASWKELNAPSRLPESTNWRPSSMLRLAREFASGRSGTFARGESTSGGTATPVEPSSSSGSGSSPIGSLGPGSGSSVSSSLPGSESSSSSTSSAVLVSPSWLPLQATKESPKSRRNVRKLNCRPLMIHLTLGTTPDRATGRSSTPEAEVRLRPSRGLSDPLSGGGSRPVGKRRAVRRLASCIR